MMVGRHSKLTEEERKALLDSTKLALEEVKNKRLIEFEKIKLNLKDGLKFIDEITQESLKNPLDSYVVPDHILKNESNDDLLEMKEYNKDDIKSFTLLGVLSTWVANGTINSTESAIEAIEKIVKNSSETTNKIIKSMELEIPEFKEIMEQELIDMAKQINNANEIEFADALEAQDLGNR